MLLAGKRHLLGMRISRSSSQWPIRPRHLWTEPGAEEARRAQNFTGHPRCDIRVSRTLSLVGGVTVPSNAIWECRNMSHLSQFCGHNGLDIISPTAQEFHFAAVVKLLKSRLQDEEQMNRAIVALMTAISQKTPLASLGGRLLTSSLLTAALDEIRPLCPFPVCPAMLDMEYSPSLLDQEIQKVLSNVGDPAHVSYTLLFIRLDPSTFTLFKITPTPTFNMAGYTYLWNLREVWQHLELATSFHMWHSKQMRLGTMAELESLWGISKQIVRAETYRGDQEVLTWPGVRSDVCSTLGLLLVLGLQAQVRGMALEAQKSCLDLLRRILRITALPDTLLILRVWAGASIPHHLDVQFQKSACLEASRHNFDGMVPVPDVIWFFLRLPSNGDGFEAVPVPRIQKRMIHIVSQAVEETFAGGKVCLRQTPPKQADEAGCETPWTAGTRSSNANLARQELLKRFLQRGAGFVSGLNNGKNEDLKLLETPVIGTKDKNAGSVAANQWVTAYFASAADALLRRLAQQDYRHISIFEDGSKIATHEVLNIFVSCDGLMLCSPLSLMPQLKFTADTTPEQNMQKLDALQLEAPLQELKRKHGFASTKEKQLCPTEKITTRMKLLAVNHSLHTLIKFRLSDSKPAVPLRPARNDEIRKSVMVNGRLESFLWSPSTKQSCWQSTNYEGFKTLMRVNVLCDEGDATAHYQLALGGLACMIHRDQSHKLHRCEILACPDMALARKHCLLIAKFDKAPWATSAFGRRLKEARERVHELDSNHILFDVCAGGIIADRNMPPDSSLADVKRELVQMGKGGTGSAHRSGRWADFVDSFHRLKREWHSRLFFHLYALMLEGTNPFHFLASAMETQGKAEAWHRWLALAARPSAAARSLARA
ncbi:hypothetical protein AK812_SmicGene33870 [Symbiodinium microadriaticum]|uniref:Uncharacterized protein n=1 Tax=Symbiodinium microadriaticum TaxID=2951 RepID=A0A1Q9CQF8_SYMMI|nr:hypothetical protein AK812_SmicGene33870 [Symbiodinium microadriaticum]